MNYRSDSYIKTSCGKKSNEFNKEHNKDSLWILKGIPEKLVKMCVQNSKCKVSFEGSYSSEFPVSTGLKQEDFVIDLV